MIHQTYFSEMNKLTAFLKESYEEMSQHVTWPSYSELQNSSVVVLVASLIFALVIGLIDAVFNLGLDTLYRTLF